MPGINLFFTKNNLKSRPNEIAEFPNLEEEFLLSKKNCSISVWKYENYPLLKLENQFFLILFEGFLYSKNYSEVEKLLFERADELWNKQKKLDDFSWLNNEDAEFILLIYNKKLDEIIIQNDIQARLPLYYSFLDDKILVSRNIAFVKNRIENNFSKHSLADYLLFGYPLRNETLYSNVRRLYPASSIKINLTNLRVELFENPSHYNFELKTNSNNKYEILELLKNCFVESCKNRTGIHSKNVLSLSGGLDSRIVGGGLIFGNIPFYSSTLIDPWKFGSEKGISEVRIASELASRWNSEIRKINSGAATANDLRSLLKIKQGHNHLGSSYLLRYLSEVRKEFGKNITFLTGDGGDKVIKYLLASNKLKSNDDVIKYIIKFHHRFYPKQIASLLDISTDEIYDGLLDLIKSYPEKDYNYKFVHFVMNERVRNWLFEGEDRNRYYFWSTTPFYSYPFFKVSMKTPDNIKFQNSLYIEMLRLLDSGLENITYANTSKKINSTSSFFYNIAKNNFNKLPHNYREKIKSIVKKKPVYSSDHNFIVNYIKRQFFNSKILQTYLNIDEINKLDFIEQQNLKMLFTITSLLSNDDFSSLSNSDKEKEFIFN